MQRWGLAAVTGLMVLALARHSAAADAGACHFAPAAGTGQASNAFDRLVALTNEQRGLGGTGVVAQREERGLGGTGIVGVVTGFGSICVNGFEVQMAANTTVSVEGLPAAAGDVRLGQVVEIEAYTGANGLSAARVDVAVAVAGPVSAIADDRASLTVAGQSVAIAGFGGSTDISAVRRGDWVVVSGLRRSDDSIAGTSIVRLPRRGREVFVSGTARANAGRVGIGDLPITAAIVTPGATVAVRGTLNGGTLRARAVQAATGFSQAMGSVSLQAYGPHLATELQRFGIAAPTAPVDTGAPTQIDGTFDTGGTFVPQRVETPPPPVEGAARPAPPTAPPPEVRPIQNAPAAPAQPQRPAQQPTRPSETPPPQPVDRPVLPDLPRPVRPERAAPPERPAPPPERPQRPDPVRPPE